MPTLPVSWPGLARPPTSWMVRHGKVAGGLAKPGHDTGRVVSRFNRSIFRRAGIRSDRTAGRGRRLATAALSSSAATTATKGWSSTSRHSPRTPQQDRRPTTAARCSGRAARAMPNQLGSGDLALRLWLLVSQFWLIVLGGGNRRCQLDAARLELFRDLADQFYRQHPVLEFC
jgi:hypothetical protein